MKVKVSPRVLISIISILLISGVVVLAGIASTWAGGTPAEDANAAQIFPGFLNPVWKLFGSSQRFPVFVNPVLKHNAEVVPTATMTITATATPTSTETVTPTSTTTGTQTITATYTPTNTTTSTATPTRTVTPSVTFTPTRTWPPYPYP